MSTTVLNIIKSAKVEDLVDCVVTGTRDEGVRLTRQFVSALIAEAHAKGVVEGMNQAIKVIERKLS